jgi:hypothetical protein
VEVKKGFLLVKSIPYVNTSRVVRSGTLVCQLSLAGNTTTKPGSHVAYFAGEYPCNKDGSPLTKLVIASQPQQLLAAEVMVDHTFSSKPFPLQDGYPDYYQLVTTYAAIVSGAAEALDPSVTAKTFPVIEPTADESVFRYIDTASTRAQISVVTDKLASSKVAIVGLGGTGTYVLDLVAKTPVKEIHLFDGDVFSQHNAFRSPGAPSVDVLRNKPQKVKYFADIYDKMHRYIFPHDGYLDASNVEQLRSMDFVFLCLDKGSAKIPLVAELEALAIPFVDVGMGVYLHGKSNSLGGIIRITASTTQQREHVHGKQRISFGDGDGANEYQHNIQIADLNALNASLAVIKWKKLAGFYLDLEKEHHSTYTIDGNILQNEDQRL